MPIEPWWGLAGYLYGRGCKFLIFLRKYSILHLLFRILRLDPWEWEVARLLVEKLCKYCNYCVLSVLVNFLVNTCIYCQRFNFVSVLIQPNASRSKRLEKDIDLCGGIRSHLISCTMWNFFYPNLPFKNNVSEDHNEYLVKFLLQVRC